jgi:hypothetical protein
MPSDLYTAVTFTDQRMLDSSRLCATRRSTGTSTGGTSPPLAGPSRTAWLLARRSSSSVSSRSASPSSSRVDDLPHPGADLLGRLPGDVLPRCRGEQPGGAVPQGLGYGRAGGHGGPEPQGHYYPAQVVTPFDSKVDQGHLKRVALVCCVGAFFGHVDFGCS